MPKAPGLAVSGLFRPGLPAILRCWLLLLFSLMSAQAIAAGPSPFCPTQSLTVAKSGSVTSINLTSCDGPINIGMVPGTNPVHGSIIVTPQSGPGNQTVTYSHNGDTATSDTFTLLDENDDFLTFNVTITPPASSIVVTPSSLPAMQVGVPFSQALSSTGGASPYSYSLSGSLPAGLTLSGNTISGTPTGRVSYAFTIRSTDNTAAFVDKGYTGTVANPSLTLTSSTGTAISGAAFSQTLSTSGGVAPYTYALETGSFPAGISVSGGGVVSGTTTASAGNYPVTLRVTDSSSGAGSYFEVENYTLTVSPAPSVSIAVSPASVNEDSGTNLVYTVTRSANLSSPTVVNITTGGTATSGTDYTGGVATVTIAAGATTATINITPTTDSTVEADETVILTVATGTGYTVGSPSSATGTILNDDVAALSINDVSVTEGNSGTANAAFTVTLSSASSQTVTVNYATADGTATAGSDYTAASGTLTFSPGQTSKTVTVLVTGDTLFEANETFVVNLSSATNATISDAQGVGTITNDDAAPILSINDVTVTEGNSGTTAATFTVSLSAASGATTTVNYATADGTATAGSDYTAASGTLTFSPGQTTKTVTVLVNGDTTPEANETFFVNLSSATNATIADNQGLGTITNDDVPTLSINDVTQSEGDSGTTNFTFTVSLSAPAAPGGVTFDIATADGTATAGSDYTAKSLTSQTIPAGSSTYSFTVLVTGDTVFEPNETFLVNVSNVVNATVADGQGVGTISNDDAQPTLSINDVTLNEGNSGTTSATFTVTLSGAVPGGLTVNYATADGTATAGSDYTAASGTLTFAGTAGETQTVTVQVNGDTLNEPDETFFVNLSAASSATIADGQGLGTITNDDAQPSLSVNDVTVTEGNSGTTSATFTVTLNAASGQVVTVNYASANGTATAGSDYTAISGTLTFTPGQTTKTVTVLVNGDTTPETDETFFLNLSGAANATISDNQGLGTIINDDVPVTLSPTSLTNGTVALAYSWAITASGGVSPYSYAVTSGSLPAGMTLSPGGALSGTPTAGGTFNFTITATESSGSPGPYTGSQAYTLVIAAPTITLTSASLATATISTSYSASIPAASGGTAPYSYVISAGSLPAGLTLNASTGAITGTPTGPLTGNFNFSVAATDSSTGSGPYTGLQAYVLNVIDVPPVAGAVSVTRGYGSAAANVALNLSGGAAVSVAVAAAPAHGTAIVSGTNISYQPTAGYAGTDSFTYTATNTGGTSTPATVTVTVSDPVITVTAGGSLAATVGVAYTRTFTWNGGSTPFGSYQVTNLPAGVSITGSTANSVTISGTPTQAGSFSLNTSATDSSTGNGPYTVGQAFTLTVSAPVLALSPAAATFTPPYGTAYSQAFTASGGVGPYTYVRTGSLPPGITLTGNTLSGTPTAPGSYSFTITATDTGATGTGAPFAVAHNYTISVAAPTITVSGTMPNSTGGQSYSQTVTGSGGVAPYTYSLSAGAFPPGLSLNASTGTLSGATTVAGTFSYIIRATDANGQHGDSVVYTITVAAPTLTMTPASGSLTAPYATAYSQVFTASGGSGSFSYTQTGALPAGVSFSSGTLSGTPTAPGSYPITVKATDTVVGGSGAPFSVTNNYTLTVAAPTITLAPTTLPGTTGGLSYSQSVTASGGVSPYGYAVTAGALPTGLTLNTSSGAVTGTTSAAGSFNFTVTATDANGQTGTQAYSIVVAAPTLTLTPATGTLTLTYGAAYSQTFTAAGGSNNFSYSETGALPAGVSFNTASATLSGTPTAPGSYSITVKATDTTLTGTGAPFFVSHVYTLSVPAPVITLAPTSLPGSTGGLSYSQSVTASGGVSPYGYAVTAGALPTGLTLNASTGAVTGATNVVGSFNFTVTATDANGQTGSQAYAIAVAAPTLTLTPAAGTLTATYGAAYSQLFTAAGGSNNFSYSETGALPAGVSFSNGTLSGTPTVPGSYAITVSAVDTTLTGAGAPFTVSHNYTLSVPSPTIALTPTTVPNSTAGLSYSQSLTAGGGVAPYSYAVTAGAVPGGLTLSSSGVLSGSLTTSGTFNFTVTATDANGQTGTQAYTVVVAVPTITLTPGTLPGVTAGTAYSQALTITGGIAPYTVTQSGSLPAGLSFNTASRTFSGTPTQSGSFNISVTVTDSTGGTAATVTNNYTLSVAVPTLGLTPATVPAATAGVAYSQTYVASGGIAPYSYVISGGALPAGLTLNSASGALSGTPTVAGTFNFNVTATDSTTGTPATISIAYTLALSAPTIAVTPATLPQSMQGVPFSVTLAASGGTAPYAFAVTTGSLPAGLSLAAGGALTGTPTAPGNSSFTVTATDALGFTGTVNYALVTTSRPDPTQDKEVRGIMTAELDSMRRMATAQITNFQQRMGRLHGATSGGFSSTLNLSYDRYCPMADNQGNSPACSTAPVMQQIQSGALPDVASNAASDGETAKAPVGIWTAGSVRYAKRSPDSTNDSMSFRSDGVSMGADYRFGDDFVFGGGLGYGSSDTDVGSSGSRSSGDAVTVALYGSYNPGQLFFVDGLLGYQTLSYDQRRYVTANGNFVSGSRDGDQWLASVSLGSDVQRGKFQLTPYLRLDVAKASLDGYTEQGDAVYGLSYGDLDADTSSANAGFRLSMNQKVSWGVFIPQLTLEYQHDLKDKSHEYIQYADLLSTNVFRLDSIAYEDERVMTGVGLQFNVTDHHFSLGLDYRGTIGADNDHSYQLNLEKRF